MIGARMDTALTAALAEIDAVTAGQPDVAILAATARGLMRGYEARWVGSPWRTVCVEQEYRLPIINPDTGKPSRTFTQAGKWDGIATFESKPFLVEHKTTSEDIADPNAPYWRRLEIDAQVSGYMLAQWQGGTKLAGTLYDCVRKPGIRPKQITKADRESIIRDGTYHGQRVPESIRSGIGTMSIENADLFELRLSADVIERQDWYYARRTIYRIDSQILDYARELWETADEIRLARVNDRHYRNSGACMQWGVPCKFLGLCSGHSTPESPGWARKKSVHSELTLDGDGRNVLTGTRLQTFRTCRRKHYYSYELGLEKSDKEESDALYFGSLFHRALACWWASQSSCNGEDQWTKSDGCQLLDGKVFTKSAQEDVSSEQGLEKERSLAGF